MNQLVASLAAFAIAVTLWGLGKKPKKLVINKVHENIPLNHPSLVISTKRTKAFRSETAIQAETNPFARRNLVNTDMTLKLNLEMIQMLIKLSNNEKINDEELKKITEMKNVLKTFVDDRTFENNKDLDYLNKITKD